MVQIESAADLTDPAVFGDAQHVGVTGGTSTPIEDLEAVVERIYALAGTPDAQPHAPELAHDALLAVAEPAYRSTSIGRGQTAAIAARGTRQPGERNKGGRATTATTAA